MGLPDDCDATKIVEAAIGLMYLTLHGRPPALRAWKSMDWDVLDMLHEKGWISDPKTKARSVILTNDGATRAQLAFEKQFKAKP